MLAVYSEIPRSIEKCAIVNVVSNNGIYWNKDSNVAHSFSYLDSGSITYSQNIPRVVEILVERKTGKRIRFGCK